MRVSLMRNFSTCKDAMKQIRNEHKLLGKEHISAIQSTELFLHRSTSILQHRSTTVQNQKSQDPDGYAKALDERTLHVSREDIADILQTANEADNLFMQQRTVPAHQQREEKDEYGVYRDDQGCARDVDGNIINVSKEDIRKLMERALRDEHNYICLPEHVSSFTQTKLVPEIYTKDEINEMFYQFYGAQEDEGDFQMKLDGVYYPLNDGISWLTTCMEEMRQDIAKIQHAADKHRPPSIDRHNSTSTDIAYYPSIDTKVDATRDGDYTIGSWADDLHHESYAVETAYRDQGSDEFHEEAAWERTHFSHPIDRAIPPTIDINPSTSIDIRPKPKSTVRENPNFDNQYLTLDEFGIFRNPDGYTRAIDGHALQVSREDIADILQMANGADNLFMQQRTVSTHQQRVTKEFYDTTGGIDNRFKKKYRHPTRPSIDVNVPPLIDRRPEFGRRAFLPFWNQKILLGRER
ncbi:hypothetical protein DY000_02006567 [Brassica cretica]|uniref:Uncharacterized protein n=1 Tax=Brassica cretica TaxID=69181 RepID=A0ABQ7BZZ6_BRACR|nr:hypothetical protein DY000_02006567 [Brassica cretica]